MSSSDSHSSSSAHPEEKMQHPRKTRGRQPGQQQESFSQDFIMEITFSDILRRLPAWPEIRSSGTRWMKSQSRNNYKDQLHSVRSEPVAEWNTWKLGGQARPWSHQSWLLPHQDFLCLHPHLPCTTSPLEVDSSLFSGTFPGLSH